jgi:hypothetical protein
MGRSKRTSLQGPDRSQHWLGPDHRGRSRSWAYEELLFRPNDEAERSGTLESLASDLALERAELERVEARLREQGMRIAGLEGRLRALTSAGASDVNRPAVEPKARTRPLSSHPARSGDSPGLAYSLTRCEGFRVDSHTGEVGFVEGLRFASRIDQPDLLEVRGGRFGRQLLLIPIEEVEEISLADERLVVRTPDLPDDHDHVHDLVHRLRSVLHHSPL